MNHDLSLLTLEGQPTSLRDFESKVLLIVNVASACGSTPQYEGLQALHERYAPRGFSVLGFPCNQFGAQEPGSAKEIRTFCSTNYGVTFPMFAKVEVNGPGRHPLFAELTSAPDGNGKAGDIAWNFEKFLVDRDGKIQRFRHKVEPEDAKVIAAIERALAARAE